MKKLFVGNIPHSTTEAELRALFEPHGAIEQVSIVTDRDTGRSRGFAFVEMTDSAEAEKAIAALNGKELGGRALNINEARPKTDRGGPPRGGGRPGGGGGRPGGGGRSSGGGGGRDDYQGHARQPREPRGERSKTGRAVAGFTNADLPEKRSAKKMSLGGVYVWSRPFQLHQASKRALPAGKAAGKSRAQGPAKAGETGNRIRF